MARLFTLASVAAASSLELEASFGLSEDSPNLALCSPCTQLTSQAINQMLNYILNAGVAGGCSAVCGAIGAGGPVAAACELVCMGVGAETFMHALDKVDLDPIYYCEVLRACHAGSDDAYLELVGVEAAPAVVGHGADVHMNVHLNVVNETGVGEFRFAVDGPGTATPISQTFMLEKGIPAGAQMLSVKLTLQDGQDSQGMPSTFEAGVYNYTFEVCQGECRSKHPHSIDFGMMGGNFTLDSSLPDVTTTPRPSCEQAMTSDDCSKAVDTMGEACQWCDEWMSCQESMMPCDTVV